jgi:hypothetical protein
MMSGARYQFSEVPNNEEGLAFVKQLKKYLNNERYSVRVRGQHLKDGLDWRKYQHGQPIACSTHLRIYINEKKRITLC